jgi:hypothetical protein
MISLHSYFGALSFQLSRDFHQPLIIPSLAFGSPKVQVDLVDADVDVTGILNTPSDSFKGVDIVGPLDGIDFITRNNEVCTLYVRLLLD